MNKDRGQQFISDLQKSGISYVLHEYMFCGIKLIDWIYSIVITTIFVQAFFPQKTVGKYMPFVIMVTILTAFEIKRIRSKKEEKLEPVLVDNSENRFNGGFLK